MKNYRYNKSIRTFERKFERFVKKWVFRRVFSTSLLLFSIVLRQGGKHRTLFSLSFCLDTKERVTRPSTPLGALCPLSESSGAERHFCQTSHRNDKRFSVSLTPRNFLHPLFANRDAEKKKNMELI
jgi:hypothetical protein